MGEPCSEQLFFSEDLEPMAAYCIGRWFRICEESSPENLHHACANFWHGIKALNSLSVATNNARGRPGAVHFSIAMSNELRRASDYIKSKIGEDPLREWPR